MLDFNADRASGLCGLLRHGDESSESHGDEPLNEAHMAVFDMGQGYEAAPPYSQPAISHRDILAQKMYDLGLAGKTPGAIGVS